MTISHIIGIESEHKNYQIKSCMAVIDSLFQVYEHKRLKYGLLQAD